jgi:hypothetical protein
MLSGEVGPPCCQSGYPRRTSKRQGWGRGPAPSRVRGTTCLDWSCAVDGRDDIAVTSQTRSSGNLRLTQEVMVSTDRRFSEQRGIVDESDSCTAVQPGRRFASRAAGGWRLAAGGWRLAAGGREYWKLETGNWKLKPIDRRPSRSAKRAREGFR